MPHRNIISLIIITIFTTLFPCFTAADDYLYDQAGGKNVWYRTVIRPRAMYDNGTYLNNTYYDSWYGAFYKGENNTIHHLTRYHVCSNDYGQPYHDERRINLYHLQMVHGEGIWKNLSGHELELPVTLDQADKYCRVFESIPQTGHNELRHVLIGGLDVDPNGRPFILYGHGRGAWAGIDRKWRLAIGDPASGKWSTYDAPHGGPVTIQNNGHIIIWGNIISVSKDTARTWINKDKLRNYGLGGVSLVNNGQSKARFVAHDTWGEVKDGEKWRNRKVFLWGEQGFITQADEP